MKGACLRHIRKRAGVTAKETASTLDISYGHLLRLERSDSNIRLDLAQMYKLASLLAIPIDKLPR